MGKELEENLERNGWTPIRSQVIVRKGDTDKVVTYEHAKRFVSPDGKSMYRPGTGVRTSFSDKDMVTYDPD